MCIRSIDIKQKLQDTFGSKIVFGKAKNSKSEYIYSGENPQHIDCLEDSLVSTGMPTSISLKRAANIIHESIKSSRKHLPWPPTPQDILESSGEANKHLVNLLSWIIYPRGQLDDSGKVKVPKHKAAKIQQLAQSIESILPNAQPSLDQVLLSLTMYRKTGSSAVVETINKLGYGISYTETVFIEDKWAEWAEKQSSIIHSNMLPSIPTTHVADNIDWKNKSINVGNETHNTNPHLNTAHKLSHWDENTKHFLASRL